MPTTVNIDLTKLSGVDPGTTNLTNARVDFSPYRAYADGPEWVTRDVLRVKCPAGVATIGLPATPVGNAYEVQERGFRGARHGYVLVPDTATVEYVDLVWVDKDTLDPEALLEAAWVALLEAEESARQAADADLQAQIDAGPGGAPSWSSVTDKPATFAPTLPIPQSGITGLDSALSTNASAAAAAQSTAVAATTALGSKVNTSTYTAGLATKADAAGTTSALAAKADLVAGVVATSQIPSVALTSGQAVANRAAMLALSNVQPGDFVAISAGADKGTYVLTDSGPSTSFSSWLPLSVPTDVVQSVNGQNGPVVLGKSDVGLGSVDNTADSAKPVSTPQQTALNLKATVTDLTAETTARTTADLTKVDRTSIDREKLKALDYVKWRPLLTALEGRDTAKVDLGVMGPSTVAGYGATWASSIPQDLARRLRQRFPVTGLGPSEGGTGVIPVPDEAIRGVTTTASPQSTPRTWSAGMQFDSTAFGSGVNHTCAYTNGGEYFVMTLDRDVTDVKVTHVAGTAGAPGTGFVKIGLGTPVTFTTYNATTILKEEVITAAQLGFPSGVVPAGSSLVWGGVATGGYYIESQIELFYKDTAKGIHVHQIGHSGYDTVEWEVNPPQVRQAIALLGLDFLVMPFYGINAGNAAGRGETAATWKTNMVNHIAWLRAGGVSCNIALVAAASASPAITFASPWSSYVTAMQEIAAADATVVFADLGNKMPNSTTGPDYGLYQADKIHLTEKGNTFTSKVVLDAVLDVLEGGGVASALPSKADLVDGKIPKTEYDGSLSYLFASSVQAQAFVVPTGAKVLEVEYAAAGAGGGSGRRGAAASVRSGGGGAGPGARGRMTISPSDIPSTVYLWVGAGGAGGAAVTANDTNGNPGTAGGKTFISLSSSAVEATAYASTQVLCSATTGTVGDGGTAAAGSGQQAGGSGPDGVSPGSGGQRRVGVGLANNGLFGGGAAGASLTAADGLVAGGSALIMDSAAGVGVYVANANSGTNGGNATLTAWRSTAGGGSGNQGTTTAGGNGGNGKFGGGGGGGGASVNGFNSGAGGAGGDGYIRINVRF